ncbi:MAG: circularly permuted type 2 ATP-grasp protein [Alphaproteobacteria bacterium]|nr:circularly permuted type 2 ATP-grasp protein [Alphaproteobacteria bacterium]
MLEPGAGPRPHWREFTDGLMQLPPEELRRRWELGQRLLRENGVTYDVHGDPDGLDRLWRLDPLPVILPAGEWASIVGAVRQRATLLDAILADLYGRRGLIAKGLVPAALLHANPGFLRPCAGWVPSGRHWLHHYAADLARGPDGQWRVVGDRTESPAGAGYALENRSIVSRVLPEFHRALHVERLGPFFDALRRSLQALSPRRRDDPRVVLLTPGPYNETYFEHAFLARHLGVTLVQGEDLTVRDDKVYLKALTGLQQVDVILRRTGGGWCDPLELRGDSTLGVAGLLQSARAGNVAMVNAIGSGLLDGASMMGFLPSIARELLAEELLMPSVRTLWCGEPSACREVLANLDRLVLRPAFASRSKPTLGATLSAAEREALGAVIAARPWEWVGQEMGGNATVPVWVEGRLEPQHAVLRVFAVATERGWEVMPGGLVRVSPEADLLAARLQSGGGGNKDVWILSDERRDPAAAERGRAPVVKLTRDNRDLPSRVADNMFWLGRYLERCEAITRLLRTSLRHAEDSLHQTDSGHGKALLRAMKPFGLGLPDTLAELPKRIAEGGLFTSVERLLLVGTHLRDRLSIDTWRALQRLREEVALLESEPADGDLIGRLGAVVLTIEAVSGLAMENMTRGPQWLFLDSGRRLERAIAIVDTVSGAVAGVEGEDDVPLDLLLEIWDSVMTYRSRYLASPRLAGVLDLLLCDESNPRSLGFQLAVLSRHVDSLATLGGASGFFQPEQRLMTILCGTIRTTEVLVLSKWDEDAAGYEDAERLLDFLRSRLWQLSEEISRTYFTHAQWRLPTPPMEALP